MSPLKKIVYHGPDDESMEVADLFKDEFMSSPQATQSVLNQSYSSRASNRTSFMGDEFLPVDMLPEEACLSPTNCMDSADGQASTFEDELVEREIFDKARHYLNPGPLLRYSIYLFSERKLLTFFLVHLICTLVILGRLNIYSSTECSLCIPLTFVLYAVSK
jgi:hypothetical protein